MHGVSGCSTFKFSLDGFKIKKRVNDCKTSIPRNFAANSLLFGANNCCSIRQRNTFKNFLAVVVLVTLEEPEREFYAKRLRGAISAAETDVESLARSSSRTIGKPIAHCLLHFFGRCPRLLVEGWGGRRARLPCNSTQPMMTVVLRGARTSLRPDDSSFVNRRSELWQNLNVSPPATWGFRREDFPLFPPDTRVTVALSCPRVIGQFEHLVVSPPVHRRPRYHVTAVRRIRDHDNDIDCNEIMTTGGDADDR
jgi:hypothetical protein